VNEKEQELRAKVMEREKTAREYTKGKVLEENRRRRQKS
jgi:hypothetical protein